MKKLKAKLLSQAGESLGEVLVTLLIAALALTMLASVIFTSSKVIAQSKTNMAAYYTENDKLENRSSNGNELEVSIQVRTSYEEAEDGSVIASWDDVNLLTSGTLEVTGYVNNRVQAKPVVAYSLS